MEGASQSVLRPAEDKPEADFEASPFESGQNSALTKTCFLRCPVTITDSKSGAWGREGSLASQEPGTSFNGSGGLQAPRLVLPPPSSPSYRTVLTCEARILRPDGCTARIDKPARAATRARQLV